MENHNISVLYSQRKKTTVPTVVDHRWWRIK